MESKIICEERHKRLDRDENYVTQDDLGSAGYGDMLKSIEDEENYIIDETTEEGQQMAQTYIENYPFVDFEHDGEFVSNVIVLEKPEMPPEIEGKRIVLKQDENGEYYYDYEEITGEPYKI